MVVLLAPVPVILKLLITLVSLAQMETLVIGPVIKPLFLLQQQYFLISMELVLLQQQLIYGIMLQIFRPTLTLLLTISVTVLM